MISKEIIENYLRANGVPTSAPDEQIKEVLFSAKWHHDDIDTALMVLRENSTTHKTRVDSLHNVFHSDETLKPETISALLGIDVEIPDHNKRVRQERVEASKLVMSVVFVSLSLSLLFIMSAMWYMKIGLFVTV